MDRNNVDENGVKWCGERIYYVEICDDGKCNRGRKVTKLDIKSTGISSDSQIRQNSQASQVSDTGSWVSEVCNPQQDGLESCDEKSSDGGVRVSDESPSASSQIETAVEAPFSSWEEYHYYAAEQRRMYGFDQWWRDRVQKE